MMDFAAARAAVQARLDELSTGPEAPKVLDHGFDAGDAWAPLIDWDGISGTYLYLVDKASGELTPVSFNELDEDLGRAGDWPSPRAQLISRTRQRLGG